MKCGKRNVIASNTYAILHKSEASTSDSLTGDVAREYIVQCILATASGLTEEGVRKCLERKFGGRGRPLSDIEVVVKYGFVSFGGTLLPHWILHPHKSNHDAMAVIQELQEMELIPHSLRDIWLECVSDGYVQSCGPKSGQFWNDVTRQLEEKSAEVETTNCPKLAKERDISRNFLRKASCCAGRELFDLGVLNSARIRPGGISPSTKESVTRWWTTDTGDFMANFQDFGSDERHIFIVKSSRVKGRRVGIATESAIKIQMMARRHRIPYSFVDWQKVSSGNLLIHGRVRIVLLVTLDENKVTDSMFWGKNQFSHAFTLSTCANERVQHRHVKIVDPKALAAVLRAHSHLAHFLFPQSGVQDTKRRKMKLYHVLEAVAMMTSRKTEVLERLNTALTLLPLHTSNVFTTGMLAWAACSQHSLLVINLLKRYSVCHLDDLQQSALMKVISVAARRTGRWIDDTFLTLPQLCHCVGIDLFTGRCRHESDMENEHRNRTDPKHRIAYVDPDTQSEEVGIARLEKAVRANIAQMMDRSSVENSNWDKHISDMQVWVSSGSTGGVRVTKPNAEGSGPRERVKVDKRLLCEHLPPELTRSWLTDAEPVTVGTASEKYENGKARAIYGTDFIGYSIMSFPCRTFERLMNRVDGFVDSLTGVDEMAELSERINMSGKDGVYSCMIDFKDFNIQHTLKAQSLVFKTAKDYITDAGWNAPDMLEALDWSEKALQNQWVYFPQNKKGKSFKTVYDNGKYRIEVPTKDNAEEVTQGLFSGVRPTNFINTILNKSYMDVAMEYLIENTAYRLYDLKRLHKGDDVWLTCSNPAAMAYIYDIMTKSNLIFASAKQMMGTNEEFLRVNYSNGMCMGYLPRCISSALVAPLQNESEIDVVGKAEEVLGSITTMFRRGADPEFVNHLCTVMLASAMTFKYVDDRGKVRTRQLPVRPLAASYFNNGIDAGPSGTVADPAFAPDPPPRCTYMASETVMAETPSHMSQMFVNKRVRPLNLDAIAAHDLVEVFHEQNVASTVGPEEIKAARLRYTEHLLNWADRMDARRYPNKLRLPIYKQTLSHQSLIEALSLERRDTSFDGVIQTFIPTGINPAKIVKVPLMTQLDRALRSSEYKSIAAVRAVVGGDMITQYNAAIATLPNDSRKQAAQRSMTKLVGTFGICITNKLLAGFHGDGNHLQYYCTPVLSSLITAVALECLIAQAPSKVWHHQSREWTKEINKRCLAVLHYVAQHTDWLHACSY